MRIDDQNYNEDRSYADRWLELLRNITHLNPGQWIDPEILCTYLFQLWWTSRYEPTTQVVYLPFDTTHYASMLLHNGRTRNKENSFKGISLDRKFGSVVPYVKHRRVCFFLERQLAKMEAGVPDKLGKLNHFFPVVFDYHARKAYVFGATMAERPRIRVGEANWTAWHGPGLWTLIGQWLDWDQVIGDPDTVTVVGKTWRQASRYSMGLWNCKG